MPLRLESFLIGYATIGCTLFAMAQMGAARYRERNPAATRQLNTGRAAAAAALWPLSITVYIYYTLSGR